MESENKGLVKKLGWAYNIKDVWPSDIQSIAQYQKLEDEGYGMLAEEKFGYEVISEKDSVVCPDGTVLTPEQIDSYWTERYKKSGQIYDSTNPEDVKMHKARVYYLGFKH